MAWPPASIAADKADGTATPTDHPGHHNSLATAINDLVTWAPIPAPPNLVFPIGMGLFTTTTSVGLTANDCKFVRVIPTKTGQLRDVSTWNVTSASNVSYAVYDTGETTPNVYTRLATSGTIAAAGTAAWQTWDPNLAVVAGRHYMLGVSADGAVNFASVTQVSAGMGTLPTSFMPCNGGNLPKIFGRSTTSHPAPATVSEANMLTVATVPLIIARIS